MVNIYPFFFSEFILLINFRLLLYRMMQKTIQKIHLLFILICLAMLSYFSWAFFTEQNLLSNSKSLIACILVLSTLILNLFNLKGSKMHHLSSFLLCCCILSLTAYFVYSTQSIISSGSVIVSLLVLQSAIYLSSKIHQENLIIKTIIASSMLLLFLMFFLGIENDWYHTITSIGLIISSILLFYTILRSNRANQ